MSSLHNIRERKEKDSTENKVERIWKKIPFKKLIKTGLGKP